MGQVVQLAEARVARERRRDEPWVSKVEIAKHFAVSTRTIENWMRKGMPFAKRFPNSHAKFQFSACDDWWSGR